MRALAYGSPALLGGCTPPMTHPALASLPHRRASLPAHEQDWISLSDGGRRNDKFMAVINAFLCVRKEGCS